MLAQTELDYIEDGEKGYCFDHPAVIAETHIQVVDRATKQLLVALQANGFELNGNILKRGNGWLQYDAAKWQYSNDAGATWQDIGGQISHANLSNIGTNTHAQIDTALSALGVGLPIGYDTTLFEMVSGAITGATNANPIEITCVGHGLMASGTAKIRIFGVLGNTNANGENLTATYVSADKFTIGVAGNGTYTAATGTWQWLDGVRVKAGWQALSADNTVVYTGAADAKVSFTANLANGLSEAANTKYRLWIGKNNAEADELVISTSESATPNQIDTAAALISPRVLRWTIRNNASSNIMPFAITARMYQYLTPISYGGSDETEILDESLGSTAWSSPITFGEFVPSWGQPFVSGGCVNVATGSIAAFFRWRVADDGIGILMNTAAPVNNIGSAYPFPVPNCAVQFGNVLSQTLTFRFAIWGYQL